jgi:hypothetical protein
LKNYKMMKNLLENKNIDKILKRGGIFWKLIPIKNLM